MLDCYARGGNMGRTKKRVNVLNDVGNSADRLETSGDDTTIELELEPRSEIDYDTFKDFSKTEIYKQLRPLLVCMRLFGLYFKRTVGHNRKGKTECIAWLCGVVNLVMICNVLRSFSVYRVGDNFDAVLVQRVLFTIWSLECMTKGLLLMWYCYKQNGLPQFFREWAVTCRNARIGSLALTMMRKFICLSCVFILFNSVGFTMIIIHVPVLGNIYHEVVWRNADQLEDQLVFKIALAIFAVLNSSFSMFPVSLYVVLTLAISKQMKRFADELATAVYEDEFNSNIEGFRMRHLKLCNMVSILDRVFSPMIGAVFVANIPMFCLVLFTMVTSTEVHVSLVLINLFWLTFILLQMFIVSIAAAYVSVKAHEPLEQIYTIRFSRTSNDVQLQMFMFLDKLTGTQIGLTAMKLFVIDMFMFLNKLTGTQIGLTAMKLFVIDKPTILTVAGMMVTYFVLLIQFKMPVAPICNCNLTGALFSNGTFMQIHQVTN